MKTAARLVSLLPKGAVAAIPQTRRPASPRWSPRSSRDGRAERRRGASTGTATNATQAAGLKPKAGLVTRLMWGALALAFYFLIVELMPDRNLESSERETVLQRS